MDNFVEGVWATYALTPAEERAIAAGRRLHLVLVEGAIRELGAAGRRRASLADLEVSADFLGFRHYTVERLRGDDAGRGPRASSAGPGRPTIPRWRRSGTRRTTCGRLIVVTFGSQGVAVFDGREDGGGDAFVPVIPVPVAGTTVGCGDAFVAGFLAEWRRTRDVTRAIEAGAVPGAAATAWRRPLPDDAYGDEAHEALRAADAAAVASR